MIEPTSSLQFVALKVSEGTPAEILHAIDWMQLNGSSVVLNWGEDTGCWEVSWITVGQRFTGIQSELKRALLQSLNKALEVFGTIAKRTGAAV